MSEKNVGRAAMNGGKLQCDQESAREANKKERRQARQYLKHILHGADPDEVPVPCKQTFWKEGSDCHIRVALKWLDAQVGRIWDDVYSDISKLFGQQQHAEFIFSIKKYLDRQVAKHELDAMITYCDLFVDPEGYLRKSSKNVIWRRNRAEVKAWYKDKRSLAEAYKWAKNRLVNIRGSEFFWAVPQQIMSVPCSDYGCEKEHKEVVEYVSRKTKFYYSPSEKSQPSFMEKRTTKFCQVGLSFCQGDRLSAAEREFWDSLSDWTKQKLIHE